MKKISILFVAFTIISLGSAFAQKTLAHFNTSDADCYKIIDNNMNIVVKFAIDANSSKQKDLYVTTFKNMKEIANIEVVSFDGALATYKMTVPKEGFFKTLEKALVLASIFEVDYNGKTMSTKELGPIAKADYDNALKARRGTK